MRTIEYINMCSCVDVCIYKRKGHGVVIMGSNCSKYDVDMVFCPSEGEQSDRHTKISHLYSLAETGRGYRYI